MDSVGHRIRDIVSRHLDVPPEKGVDFGAPMLRANVPRSYIDLNREPYEFDRRVFADELPGYVNSTSARVAGGLGTIPRIVAEGEEIYRGLLRFADALERVNTI